MLRKNTQKASTKSKVGGFPGFKETPFLRKHLEIMSDEELYRTYKLYGYFITTRIYKNVGMVFRPTRFPLEDYKGGERARIIKQRLAQSDAAAAFTILHMENIALLVDVVRERFPNLIEDEEENEI